jgi:Lactate racemase N-terminal domain
VPRIPLLSGSRLLIVNASDDTVVLRPPPPTPDPIADVRAAVRDALRFPLAGEALAAQVPRNGRVTVVAELPSLPLPGAAHDPRQDAIAATVDELRRCGVPDERQTILVAGGLARRAGRRELETLVSPHFALEFRGDVHVHDAEDPDLVEVGQAGDTPLRVNRALVEADAVVVVTAAETVLHGGPAALLAAGGSEAIRAAGASSLLEPRGASGWQVAVELERALQGRLPVIGVSLALDQPRLSGAVKGYPYDPAALERIAGSARARAFRLAPAPLRVRALRSIALELTASAVFAGPPSVAHAEALLRAIELRATELDEPLDAICVGIPRLTPHLPRERPNPLLAAYLALGLALRFWRDSFPVVEGGTLVLVHRFRRRFSHPTQQPYRAFFQATRIGPDPEALAAAERAAAEDERAVAEYRAGRTCHPLLPFADWAACLPALERLGAVVVADCRDAAAARQLGFVPTHGVSAALAMVEGRAAGRPRIGFLLSPPYFPLSVRAG